MIVVAPVLTVRVILGRFRQVKFKSIQARRTNYLTEHAPLLASNDLLSGVQLEAITNYDLLPLTSQFHRPS